jgi:hypothetical protein
VAKPQQNGYWRPSIDAVVSRSAGGAAITSAEFNWLVAYSRLVIARHGFGVSYLLPVSAFPVDVRYDQLGSQLKVIRVSAAGLLAVSHRMNLFDFPG